MVPKTQDQIDKEEADMKAEGTTFHKWNDVVTLKGTGKDSMMTLGRMFTRVHKLVARILVQKGYAEYA